MARVADQTPKVVADSKDVKLDIKPGGFGSLPANKAGENLSAMERHRHALEELREKRLREKRSDSEVAYEEGLKRSAWPQTTFILIGFMDVMGLPKAVASLGWVCGITAL
eukprot:scaffold558545_cov31-Prasinocladus_malaysianus.AAC.1